MGAPKRHVLSGLENWARTTAAPQVDADVMYLDRKFWRMVVELAKKHPSVARDAFCLSTDLIDGLATIEEDRWPSLANGVLMSFAPVFDVTEFGKACKQSLTRDDVIQLERHDDILYWTTMARIAEMRDPEIAGVIFGVSAETAAQVKELGFSGARYLAHHLNVGWKLRCRCDLILQEIQGPQGPTSAERLMTKLAQALSMQHGATKQ